jgi:hypothetical protein
MRASAVLTTKSATLRMPSPPPCAYAAAWQLPLEVKRMGTAQVYRLSGLSLVIGMLLSIVSSIGSGVLFSDTSNPAVATNPLNITLGICGVLGTALALFGLPALYARSAAAGGVLWLLGVLTIALTGMLFGIFLGLMSVIVFPALASEAPSLFAEGPPPSFIVVFIVGTLLNVVGAVMMAIPMLTRRLYPRWCGYLMLLAAVLAVISFFLNGPGPSSPISQILNIVSPLPLFVVLGYAGVQLWSGTPTDTAARTGLTAAQPA